MTAIHDLPLFVLAGLLLNVTPGPDMAYIVARWRAGGFRAGAAATFGITAGCVVHTLAAAAGLSVVARDIGDGVRDRQVVRRGVPPLHRRATA